jgi:hypothetical protein
LNFQSVARRSIAVSSTTCRAILRTMKLQSNMSLDPVSLVLSVSSASAHEACAQGISN